MILYSVAYFMINAPLLKDEKINAGQYLLNLALYLVPFILKLFLSFASFSDCPFK